MIGTSILFPFRAHATSKRNFVRRLLDFLISDDLQKVGVSNACMRLPFQKISGLLASLRKERRSSHNGLSQSAQAGSTLDLTDQEEWTTGRKGYK